MTGDSPATLVDSNVLLDVISADQVWQEWSVQALSATATVGPLVINPVIYAEISIRFSRVEDLEAAVSRDDFVRAPLPWEAAFLAGKCFRQYRTRGGEKRSPLPDFFIGAHAAVSGLRLLTRDARRYRTYFPGIEVIAP